MFPITGPCWLPSLISIRPNVFPFEKRIFIRPTVPGESPKYTLSYVNQSDEEIKGYQYEFRIEIEYTSYHRVLENLTVLVKVTNIIICIDDDTLLCYYISCILTNPSCT